MNFCFASTKLFEDELNSNAHMHTDNDDETITTGIGMGANGPETEKILRLQISGADAEQMQRFPDYHSEALYILVHEIAKEHPMKVFDNKGKLLRSVNKFTFSKPQKYYGHFTVERDDDNKDQRMYISVNFRIQTTLTMKQIRANNNMATLLAQNQLSLRVHHWNKDVRSVVNIGFITELDATKYKIHEATAMVVHAMQLHPEYDTTKVPIFRLVHRRVSIHIEKEAYSSLMYGIEVEKVNRAQGIKTFSKYLNRPGQDTYLIPKMRAVKPKHFGARINYHKFYIRANQWAIKLEPITPKQMKHLHSALLQIEGVNDIVPTNSTPMDGSWRLMVNRNERKAIQKYLKDEIPTLIEQLVPEEDQESPFQDFGTDTDCDSNQSEMSIIDSSVKTFDDNLSQLGLTVDDMLKVNPDSDCPLEEISLELQQHVTSDDGQQTLQSPTSGNKSDSPGSSISGTSEKDELSDLIAERQADKKRIAELEELVRQAKMKQQEHNDQPTKLPLPPSPPKRTSPSPMDIDTTTTKRTYAETASTPPRHPHPQQHPSPSLANLSHTKKGKSPENKRVNRQGTKLSPTKPITRQNSTTYKQQRPKPANFH